MSQVDKSHEKIDLKSLSPKELSELVTAGLKKPPYRVGQIYKWIYRGASFDEMTDLPAAMRQELLERCTITRLTVEQKQVSRDGTVKYLFRAADGEYIESVLMSYRHGNTICLSTQVGCNMGCTFCASGLHGRSRNLSAGEIIDQIMAAEADSGQKISNVVLMGMGEPLDNLQNVLIFIENANNPNGLNIGIRHISLSTCGLCDKIMELADLGLGITLSVSLHAPNDELRSRLMPVNKKYNIACLMKACTYYIKNTKRRISFEYALIEGINDTEACALELSHLLSRMLCHVNLIPVNSVTEKGFSPGRMESAERFKQLLERRGINATIRRRLGDDIDAACGQLRRRAMPKGEQL